MQKRLIKHGITIIGIGILAFLSIASGGAQRAGPRVPEVNIPPVTVKDKITAFALMTYVIDQGDYDIQVFDFQNGRITTNNTEFIRGERSKDRADLTFELTPNNTLEMRSEDWHIYVSGSSGYEWSDINYEPSTIRQMRNTMYTSFDYIQSNPSELEKAMDHFLGNFRYNYVLLKPLTEVGRKVFADENLINRTYKWQLPLIDFQENRNPEYNKKYVALFQYKVTGSNRAFSRLFSNTINLNVYTDETSLAMIPKNQLVEYSGVLVGIDDVFTSENFNFDFFTQDSQQ